MDRDELNQHLSQMSTQWTMVLQAHGDEADAANTALAGLAQRYLGVVYRYLLGAVRDPDAAAELSQELALRILRGGFRHADPHRGRFRDYLKTALIHLVNDYHKAQRVRPSPLPHDVSDTPGPAGPEAGADFLPSWRAELLDRTWTALAAAQPMYHAVLLFRVENPDVPSPQMAEQLSAQLGNPMRPDQVRKALQRSHAKFAELLVDEVATSLGDPSHEELAEEVRELDLLKYCRSALDRCHRKEET
jgi:DNA-directed RNA polymerase specialized sigma24 family protein